MTSITEQVQERLDDEVDAILNPGPYVNAVKQVMRLADQLEAESPMPGTGGFIAAQLRLTVGQAMGIVEQENTDEVPNLARLTALARWLVSLDEPDSTDRRTVNLNQIITTAREALDSQ